MALSTIAADQAAPTKNTLEKIDQLLDYAVSQEDAAITYHASDMVLAIHSDASYLSEPKARSRAGGHFLMSSDRQMPPNNGPVLTLCQIIRTAMSSACEAEIGAMYMNASQAVPARKNTREDGASTSKDANADRQFRSALGSHKQHSTAPDKGNGYTCLLVEMSRYSRPV